MTTISISIQDILGVAKATRVSFTLVGEWTSEGVVVKYGDTKTITTDADGLATVHLSQGNYRVRVGKELDEVIGVTGTGTANLIDLLALPTTEVVSRGVPAGGTAGQVLAKATATNYDVEWVDQTEGGGGATNLGYTASPINGIVTSSTGSPATIPLADNTNAGLLSPSEKTKITSGLVPYTGATQDVDLGTANIKTNKVKLNTTPNLGTLQQGDLYWDTDNHTASLKLNNSVSLQIGQETQVYVRNNSGATITNGSIVYQTGVIGGSPTIALARADAEDTSYPLAVATEDIANNSFGYCTVFGLVRSLNTSAYNPNDKLYLSATTAGQVTTTPPTSPNYVVYIGSVITSSPSVGEILVSIQTPLTNSNTLGVSQSISPTQNAVKQYIDAGLASKESSVNPGTTSQYYRGDKTWQTLDKNTVGLGNVSNVDTSTTSNITDSVNKRFVNDSQQAVINNTSGTNTGDQNVVNSIAVTGQPTITSTGNQQITLTGAGSTTITSNNTTKTITISSTGGSGSSSTWGSITGNIQDQSDLKSNFSPTTWRKSIGSAVTSNPYDSVDIGATASTAISSMAIGGGELYIQPSDTTYTQTTSINANNKSNITITALTELAQIKSNSLTNFKGVNSVNTSYRYKHNLSCLTLDNTTPYNPGVTAPATGSVGVHMALLSDVVYRGITIRNYETGVKIDDGAFYNNYYDLKVEDSKTGIYLNIGATDKPNTNHFFGAKILNTDVGLQIDSGNNNLIIGGAIETFNTGFRTNGIGNKLLSTRLESNDRTGTTIYAQFDSASQNNTLDDPYVSGNDWDSTFETHIKDFSNSNTDGNPFFGGINNYEILTTFKDQAIKKIKNAQTDHPFIQYWRFASGYLNGYGLLELIDNFVNSGNPISQLTINNRATGWLYKGVRGISQRVKPVINQTTTTPPGSPTTGDRYIVATGGTGAWAGKDGQIAEWSGSAWVFTVPTGVGNYGTGCWDLALSKYYRYNGTAWVLAEMAYINNLGFGWFATGLSANSSRIQEVATPTSGTDAANKSYVDNKKKTFTFGDGTNTTYTLTHNLNTQDVVTQLRLASTNAVIDAEIINATVNTVTVTFDTAPSTNSIKAVILG